MALPSEIQAITFFFPKATGVVLLVVPGDTSFGIEVQRAPDNGSGQPNVGAAESIIELPAPTIVTGQKITDHLALDGAKRFYRARHIRAGWTAGNWTAWTSGLIPTTIPTLEIILPPPPMLTDTPLLGDQRPVLQMKTALIPNAEFDQWRYY